jgi:subtilisin family serine protease
VIPNDPRYDLPAFRISKVFDLWERSTGGQEVVVAVISSGVNAVHPEFKDKLVSPFDFINNNTDASPDDTGGGTNNAGVIAAVANNSVGMAGICWTCKVMPLDIADAEGNAPYANTEKAFKHAVDKGAKVILMSFSYTTKENAALQQAIKQAYAKGITIITNVPLDGKDTATDPTFPSIVPEVITVISTNDDDTINSLSNFGRDIDVAAPGIDVRGPSPETIDGYRLRSGNGVAAGVVAGIAGLLRSMYPQATPTDVFKAITTTADTCCGGKISGGRVNAIKAADYLEKLYPSAPPAKTGDLNGDGKANISDLSVLLTKWNSADAGADLNKDGKVGLTDLSILLTNWTR